MAEIWYLKGYLFWLLVTLSVLFISPLLLSEVDSTALTVVWGLFSSWLNFYWVE